MKVTIAYQCELEDIPYTVCELLANLQENDIPFIGIDIQDAILHSNEANISEALASIDQARIKLTKIDQKLLDFSGILAGYAKANADIYTGYVPEGTQEVMPMDILQEKKATTENND